MISNLKISKKLIEVALPLEDINAAASQGKYHPIRTFLQSAPVVMMWPLTV